MARDTISPNAPGLDQDLAVGRVVTATRSRFGNDVAAGAVLAALIDPFGAGSTYATVGVVPSQLALVGSTIVRGAGAVTIGGDYGLWIVVTSPDGVPQPAVRLTLRAVLPLGGLPASTPAPGSTGPSLPAGLASRLMAWELPAQADGSALVSATDSAGGVFSVADSGSSSGPLGTAPSFRTGGLGGKPYISVADGARLGLPTGAGAGAALKAVIESGTFTAIAFVSGVANGGRSIGAVLGSYANPGSFMLRANGQRAGFFHNAENSPFDFPWTGGGLLSVAQVSKAAYPFRQAGQAEPLNRLYLNGGCVFSSTGQQIGLGPEGLGLFGISNGYPLGNFAGNYHGHLIWPRALSPAEVKQAHAWACGQLGQPTPWAGLQATYGVFGNSLDDGYFTTALEYTPMALAAAAMGLPLGAWDNLGVSGQSTEGMLLNIGAGIRSVPAVTGVAHKLLLGEYYNSVWGIGLSPQQTVANIAQMMAAFRAAEPGVKVLLQTPSNTQSDVGDGHARFDAFMAALLALPADGVVRLDQDAHIGRAGDVGDVIYFQGDRLHLTGAAGTCGYAAKAALMAAAFAAV